MSIRKFPTARSSSPVMCVRMFSVWKIGMKPMQR